MLEMWTNFVKYLDPTPGPGGPDLGETRWQQVSESEHSYLRIDRELSMERTEEYQERMEFWRSTLASCGQIL